jgi:hypothetical protein
VPEIAPVFARRTSRVIEIARLLAHATEGRPAERFMARLGMLESDVRDTGSVGIGYHPACGDLGQSSDYRALFQPVCLTIGEMGRTFTRNKSVSARPYFACFSSF